MAAKIRLCRSHGLWPRQIFILFFQLVIQAGRVSQLKDIESVHLSQYQSYLETRKHQRKPGGLSASIIYAYMNVIKSFDKYLQQHGLGSLPIKHLQLPEPIKTEKEVLISAEINFKNGGNDIIWPTGDLYHC